MVAGQAILWLLGVDRAPGRGLGRLAFNPGLYVIALLGLTPSAVVALFLGFQDMLWPVSLSSQLVGVTYVIAGLLGLYGVLNVGMLLGRALQPIAQLMVRNGDANKAITYIRDSSVRSLKSIALAAVAGLYVDVTIVLYSFRYFRHEVVKVLLFAVLALICVFLSRVTLPVLWDDLSKGLKAAGISLVALAGLAQFWYQSVRLPSDAPVGINYTVTLGPSTRSGNDTIVQVNLTAEDTGAVPAVALASMVAVRGIVSPGETTTRILSIFPLIHMGSFFFPSDTFSREFFVVIKNPDISALSVEIQVDFARTSWLALGTMEQGLHACSGEPNRKQQCIPEPYGLRDCVNLYSTKPECTSQPALTCPRDVWYQWSAAESALRRFTQGARTVYSQWECRGWNDINSGVDAWVTPDQTPRGSYLGILYSTRYEQLLLPKAQ